MNALLDAIRKPLQWRLLALIETPETPADRAMTDDELRQRLERLNPGDLLKLMVIMKILSWFDRLGGNHEQPS